MVTNAINDPLTNENSITTLSANLGYSILIFGGSFNYIVGGKGSIMQIDASETLNVFLA